MIRDTKKLSSCGGAYGRQFQDNYTNSWNQHEEREEIQYELLMV